MLDARTTPPATTTDRPAPARDDAAPGGTPGSLWHALNTRWHRPALALFMVVVVVHWVEHLTQAVQIYALGWPRPTAGGALGLVWPWLVTSEWMHYAYALIMMIAFVALRPGFTGRAGTWWAVAMWIQIWHHTEHLLLLVQALVGANLLGAPVPTSIAQLILPRVELHLFYNTIVTIPMIVAMVLMSRDRRAAADRADTDRADAHRWA